jgi:hypothetical protein
MQLECRNRALLRLTYSSALHIFAFPINTRQMLLCEICVLKAEIGFQNPSSIARVLVLSYSDAAHSETYGQGGYLAGL